MKKVIVYLSLLCFLCLPCSIYAFAEENAEAATALDNLYPDDLVTDNSGTVDPAMDSLATDSLATGNSIADNL